jgi:CheY-like chemotaxis protein
MGVSKSKSTRGPSRPAIFVVDDEPMLLELAESVLSRIECEIKTFTDPQEALRTYSSEKTRPDLVITDYAMHHMNGLDLIRECRRMNPKQKIILVSGTVDESILSGADVKPDRFLAKPYQPAALLELVQEVLGD